MATPGGWGRWGHRFFYGPNQAAKARLDERRAAR
jgi:hypothetical protein